MGGRTTLGEFVAGVEGLALLRLAFTDQGQARARRLSELRALPNDSDRDGSLDVPAAGDEHDLDAGYRAWSQSYDQPLRLFPIETPVVHRHLDTLPRGVILDAACGSGRHSEHLIESGHDVIGVDRSESMLDVAREKTDRARLLRGDLTALPISAASVDAAICALALVHVEDLERAFAGFGRVVRVGGRLIISDVHPVLVALGWQAQFGVSPDHRGFIRLRRHLVSDYIHACGRHGFALRSCDEPPLTRAAARTPAAGHAPEACEQAFADLPAIVVFDFERVGLASHGLASSTPDNAVGAPSG